MIPDSFANPEGYIGQFIYVNGAAVVVDQYDDFTWVQVFPEVRGEGTLFGQSIIVELRPPVRELLSNECYRFTGTVAGAQQMVFQMTGAVVDVPYLNSSQYEPIPDGQLLGCEQP